MENNELKPCEKCGGEGIERIGYGYPLIIWGVELNRTLGTIIVCQDCGYHTDSYDEPYKAFNEWNRRANDGKS